MISNRAMKDIKPKPKGKGGGKGTKKGSKGKGY